ncbi:MAG TPA: hypothetical protein VK188_03270, partial [Holophaga sp.]|nr:hypothetical protein [Holophaga sp.]
GPGVGGGRSLPPCEAGAWVLILGALGSLPVRMLFPELIPLWGVGLALGSGLVLSLAEEIRSTPP